MNITKRKVYLGLAVAVVALVLTVAFQNTEVVTVKFLFWDLTLSRFLLLVLTSAAGFIGGFVAAQFVSLKRK